jgi:hypothetical protein
MKEESKEKVDNYPIESLDEEGNSFVHNSFR